MKLFDPARHEPLAAREWSEAAVRDWIARVADDAHQRFDAQLWWPPHPLDLDGDPPTQPLTPLYDGAGGVIYALDELAQRGFAPAHSYAEAIEPLIVANQRKLAGARWSAESLMVGRSGLLLLAYSLTGDDGMARLLHGSIARNAGNPSNEMLLGVSGTMHAALAMHEATGESTWAELYREGVEALDRTSMADPRENITLWTQPFHGGVPYLGAAHGFAGNAQAILRGAHLLDAQTRASWHERIVTTLVRSAAHEAQHANWPAWWPPDARSRWLVQWCHGASGMVTSLAALDDARLDGVLAAAGELVWDAGPLAKGGGLCHGTAGSGYAFLKLHARTCDARWKARARAFAMHAVAQCDAHATQYGRRRYSLWTGDIGCALYAAACIDGAAHLPQVDPVSRGTRAD